MSVPADFTEATIARLLDQLAKGKSLSAICKAKGMPDRRTIQRWMQADDEFADRLQEARETGFHEYAEATLELVEKEKDPHKARVVLAARQWYLGKLSNAFRERPVSVGTVVNVDVADTFAAVARVLEQAAGRISGGRHSTYTVDRDGKARPIDSDGGLLAHLDGPRGERLGENEERR